MPNFTLDLILIHEEEVRWPAEEHTWRNHGWKTVERRPYAFYTCVPDLAAFLQVIQPTLEARLANSAFVNYSDELKLSFYQDGVLFKFEKGKVMEISNLGFDELEKSKVQFPPPTFLHLVFGHRTVEELREIHIDCATQNEETANLINTLFPKKPSEVWAIS